MEKDNLQIACEEYISTIQKDWSVENPKLHKFYVRQAYGYLKVTNLFIEEMSNKSNWHADLLVMPVVKMRSVLIMNNTAFRDAAAMLMAGIELESDSDSESFESEA